MGFQPRFCFSGLSRFICRWPAKFCLKGSGERERNTTQVHVSSPRPGIERSMAINRHSLRQAPVGSLHVV